MVPGEPSGRPGRHDGDVPRVLLLLPTSTYRASEFLAAAEGLGVEVVTGSDAPQALAFVMGDHFVELDLDDPEQAAREIEQLGARVRLDAVVAVDDRGALTAALASERLGLAHNSPAAVSATRDKATMRRLLAAAAVAQPAWREVAGVPGDLGAEAAAIASAASAVGYPAVVKPCSLSGSRGVVRVDDATAARAAAARVRSIARDAGIPGSAPLLVERFVPGPEVAVEGIVRAGTLDVLAVFDKPDPLDGPFFEETIYVTPSRLSVADLDAVGRLVADATAALGIVEGPVHGEVRLPHLAGGGAADDRGGAGAHQGPVLVEVAARTIGGRCARTLSFSAGQSLEELVLRHALGLESGPLPVRDDEASGVMMLPVERSGTLERVDGLERARAVRHVTGVEVTVSPGRPLRALPEGDRYLGFVFARAASPGEVEDALRAAHAALEVRIA